MMLFALASSSTAVAQILYGSLTGTVTDTSGALVPSAHITALEESKGVARDAQSCASGIYRLTDILPGTYKVTISAPGFAPQVTANLVVNENTVVRLDAKLALATATQTTTVIRPGDKAQTYAD
jgi:hypothetical protein